LIPFLRIIFSGLHAGIGIGNRLIDHLEEFIDVDVEYISHEEFQLHASKESPENDIKHFRHFKQVWTKWIEQYHQIGHRFDMAYCCVGSLTGQAAIRSSVETRGSNPQVQMNKQFLLEKFVGRNKKRSAAIANDEKKIHIKQERRNEALAMIVLSPSLTRIFSWFRCWID
jgi:hypothetical protein